MNTERITFKGAKDTPLPGILWIPDEKPCMVLQVTHGMTEHIGRYADLAEKLTERGIVVAGFDLRGHGENEGDAETATFGKGRWRQNLWDMYMFSQELDRRFEGIPRFMLGFSLGSFLLRDYLADYNYAKSAGAVIMGSGHQPKWVLSILVPIVKKVAKKSGFNYATAMTDNLSLDHYNQKYAKTAGQFAWLCSDKEELKVYLEDPLCRKHISAGLFYQLLCAMQRTGLEKNYNRWDKDTPILLLSGKDDPVGNFGKGVRAIYSDIKKAGIDSVSMHLFPGARHDVFHEKACGAADKATEILIQWLFANLPSA